MSRISTYPIQSIIVGSDKVIGTDVLNNGATKNFTFDEIAGITKDMMLQRAEAIKADFGY